MLYPRRSGLDLDSGYDGTDRYLANIPQVDYVICESQEVKNQGSRNAVKEEDMDYN